MNKRPNPRAIKAALNYTFAEVSEAQGVSVRTVRRWEKDGLPVLKDQKPFLILGSDLRGFIQARHDARKRRLEPDQLYCFTCGSGRRPAWGEVEAVSNTTHTIRVVGLCETCLGVCNRMISSAKLPEFARIFTITSRNPPTG